MPKTAPLKRTIRYPWLFAGMLIFGGLFIILLLIPQDEVPFMFAKDYMNHGGGFFVLTLFLWSTLNSRWWLQLCALVAFAVITEYLQELVPSRHFGWDDMLSNVLGIATAAAFIGIFKLSNQLMEHYRE
ncbi:VanZ family protein [Alteromonadaceae bacterium BrNp21-10]|nr:VanZ family protein [Alteromonadaceae bacterium BrNp21-10]